MKKSDCKRYQRPSKVEFVLDNLFAVELLIFPYTLLVFRKPTWTTIAGAVLISIVCATFAFVGCLYFSFPSRRSKEDICLNMLTIIGAISIVLYREWFPILDTIICLAIVGVIVWTFCFIKQQGNTVSRRTKRNIICFSRRIIAVLSIVLIIAVVGLRIRIFMDMLEDRNHFIRPIERQRVEFVNAEYNV